MGAALSRAAIRNVALLVYLLKSALGLGDHQKCAHLAL
jgi:hypothetical protein